ncbi:hypothetical protein CALVIDRAFT_568368 [Calocera viscosa TUFC12733]|uniref:Uncharacterized protein n=1 Tax=Calocera viscosa (strain TUFC12733) TaxID=1330018 RepID=A0A167H834_CALVF|nr:hypothetical protein CALVIDRAFT_568368 [Calocera viscosa TUFC12733]
MVAGTPDDPTSPTAVTPIPNHAAPRMPTTQDALDILPALTVQTHAGALLAIRLALRHVFSDRLSSYARRGRSGGQLWTLGFRVWRWEGRGGRASCYGEAEHGCGSRWGGDELVGIGRGDVRAYVVQGLSGSTKDGTLTWHRAASGNSTSTADGLDDTERRLHEGVTLAEALGTVRDGWKRGGRGRDGRASWPSARGPAACGLLDPTTAERGRRTSAAGPGASAHPVLAKLAAMLSHLISHPSGASPAHRHALLPLGAHISLRSAGAVIDQLERLHLFLRAVPDPRRNITDLAEAFFTASAPSSSTPSVSSAAPEANPRVTAARLLLSRIFHAMLDLPLYLARLLRVLLPNVLGSAAGEEDGEVWRLELVLLKEYDEGYGGAGGGGFGGGGWRRTEEEEATPTLTAAAPAQRAALPSHSPGPAQATTKQPEPEALQAADWEGHARILAIRQCLREVGACVFPDIIGSPMLPGAGQQANFTQTSSEAKSARPPLMGFNSNVLGSGSRDRATPTLDHSGSPAPAYGVTCAALTSALPSLAGGVLGSVGVSLFGGLSVATSWVVPSKPAVGTDSAFSPYGIQSPSFSSSTSTPLTGATVHAHHADHRKSKPHSQV